MNPLVMRSSQKIMISLAMYSANVRFCQTNSLSFSSHRVSITRDFMFLSNLPTAYALVKRKTFQLGAEPLHWWNKFLFFVFPRVWPLSKKHMSGCTIVAAAAALQTHAFPSQGCPHFFFVILVIFNGFAMICWQPFGSFDFFVFLQWSYTIKHYNINFKHDLHVSYVCMRLMVYMII